MRPVRLSMPALRGSVPALLLSTVLSAALVAGCGSSNDGPSAAATSAAPSTAVPSASGSGAASGSPSAAPPATESAAPSTPAPSDSPAPTSSGAVTGPNGVEKLDGEEILQRAQDAGSAASSVHVKGDVKRASQSVSLDVRTNNTEGTGKVRSGGQDLQLRLVDSTVYVRGDKALYAQFGSQSKRLEGKWLKASSTNQSFAKLTAFFNIRQLIGTVLKPGETLRKGAKTTIHGQDAIALKDSKGATLYVALDGPPYPLRIQAGPGGASSGRMDFTDWNKKVAVDAPATDSVVDVDALRKG